MNRCIISNKTAKNKDFFVIPCYKRVCPNGKKSFKTVEEVIYVRKNVLLNVIRQSVADKNLYDEVMAILMARMGKE